MKILNNAMSINVKFENVADQIENGPGGRTESDWLDTLDYLVDRLSKATSCYLEVGRYWSWDQTTRQSSGICVRVRSKQPFPFVESDYWEAAICLTGDSEKGWSDVFAFPYLKENRVSSEGVVSSSSDVDLEEFWWFNFSHRHFHSKGWSFPEGPGEWSWVKKPGDEFQTNVECTPVSNCVDSQNPIPVSIAHSGIRLLKSASSQKRDVTFRLSLVHVNRDRENTNLTPWNVRPPRANSLDVIFLDAQSLSGEGTDNLDISRFRIRGGWKPGKYHASIRVQVSSTGEENNWESEISSPFKFHIA